MLAACGGSPARTATPTTRPPATQTRAAPAMPSAEATASPDGGEVEVTGIVGSVIVRNNVISVRPLEGASVTKVLVDGTTVIRRSDGGALSLAEIRASDRILARGVLDGRGDGLLAREITVQTAVPGAQPGG